MVQRVRMVPLYKHDKQIRLTCVSSHQPPQQRAFLSISVIPNVAPPPQTKLTAHTLVSLNLEHQHPPAR